MTVLLESDCSIRVVDCSIRVSRSYIALQALNELANRSTYFLLVVYSKL